MLSSVEVEYPVVSHTMMLQLTRGGGGGGGRGGISSLGWTLRLRHIIGQPGLSLTAAIEQLQLERVL
jgi:hypothetical protein